MRLSKKYLVLIFCYSLCFFSCKRKCPCIPADQLIQIISFSKDETDTIIVRRYTKGTNYQTLQDSVLIDSSNCNYIYVGDTLQLATSSLIGHITSNFDFEIFIPSVKRLIKISDITEQQSEGLCGRCVNLITKYLMDDKTYYSAQIFIKK